MAVTDATEPATPDFYRYRPAPPASIDLDDRFLVLSWPDGSTLRAFDLWLFENAMDRAIDLATRESVADPADLPDGAIIGRAELETGEALTVTWRCDGTTSTFNTGWLHHVAAGQHRPDALLPGPEPWTAASLDQPPTRDGTDLRLDDDVLQDWLDDGVRFGLARLRNVGTDPDLVVRLGTRIGPARPTNFGPAWDVKADLAPDSTANTNLRLVPHTTVPTRETPPGFQVLHCIANTATGGWSTMTDGLALVDHLARDHPEHHEALTTLRWIFFNRGPEVDHRWSGPIIDHGPGGAPLTIRAFHPVRGFPDMADEDLPRAYAALRCFAALAADPRFQLRYPFAPGDLIIFDNRRVLRGRDRYETAGTGGGQRHLRGIYLDHDEVYSYLRVINRRRTKDQAHDNSDA